MNKHTESGSITVGIVFGVGVLGLGLASLVLTLAVGNVTKNSNSQLSSLALAAADSGVREGVYQVINEASGYTGGSFETLNGVNNNTITATDLGNMQLLVSATADNNRATRSVAYGVDLFPNSGAFDHALFSNDEITLNGTPNVVGSIYAATEIGVNGGGNGTIDGSVYSPGTISIPGGIVTGDIVDTAQPISPPVIDPTQYIAIANRHYTDMALAESDLNGAVITDEIIYIDGDVDLNNLTLTGMLIVTGDLRLNSSDINVSASLEPLTIYVGDELKNGAGDTEIEGIIYVVGEIGTLSGNVTIDGSVIIANDTDDLTLNGKLEVVYNTAYASDWMSISAIDFSAGDDPQVSSWVEG